MKEGDFTLTRDGKVFSGGVSNQKVLQEVKGKIR